MSGCTQLAVLAVLTYQGEIHSGTNSQYNRDRVRLKVVGGIAAGSVHGADLYLRGWLPKNTTLNICLNKCNAMYNLLAT